MSRVSPAYAVDTLRRWCKVAFNADVTPQQVMQVVEGQAAAAVGLPAADFTWPVVQVEDPVTGSSSRVIVKPLRFDVTALSGQHIMSRVALPLISAECVKFGHTLGCTADSRIYIDAFGLPERGSQGFMVLSRQGDPGKVYLDYDFPIGSDMFAVNRECLEYFSRPGWTHVVNPRDEHVHRGYGNVH